MRGGCTHGDNGFRCAACNGMVLLGTPSFCQCSHMWRGTHYTNSKKMTLVSCQSSNVG